MAIIYRVDIYAQSATISDPATIPATTLVSGNGWLVPANAVGVWVGHTDELAYWFSEWSYVVPPIGYIVEAIDTGYVYSFTSLGWGLVTTDNSNTVTSFALDTKSNVSIDVQSATLPDPSVLIPVIGQAWLIPNNGTGNWYQQDGKIAIYLASEGTGITYFKLLPPRTGWVVKALDTGWIYTRASNGSWQVIAGSGDTPFSPPSVNGIPVTPATNNIALTAADIPYIGGETVQSREPAEVAADKTSLHTSTDTAKVNGVDASLISPIGSLMPAEAGATKNLVPGQQRWDNLFTDPGATNNAFWSGSWTITGSGGVISPSVAANATSYSYALNGAGSNVEYAGIIGKEILISGTFSATGTAIGSVGVVCKDSTGSVVTGGWLTLGDFASGSHSISKATPAGTVTLQPYLFANGGASGGTVTVTDFSVQAVEIQAIEAGTSIAIDSANPLKPIVSFSGLGSGSVTGGSFASGIEPISIVTTLPNPVGYTGPKLVFLSTTGMILQFLLGLKPLMVEI